MSKFENEAVGVIGGVDTHKDTHTVCAVDATGKLFGTETFAAMASGYASLLKWLVQHVRVDRVGIERTRSYGSGLAAYLRKQSVNCVEVNRPNRQARRRRGKSDPADAEAAVRATLDGWPPRQRAFPRPKMELLKPYAYYALSSAQPSRAEPRPPIRYTRWC